MYNVVYPVNIHIPLTALFESSLESFVKTRWSTLEGLTSSETSTRLLGWVDFSTSILFGLILINPWFASPSPEKPFKCESASERFILRLGSCPTIHSTNTI